MSKLQLLPHEEDVIKHLLSPESECTPFTRTAMTSALHLLDDMYDIDDDNGEPLSDRVLFTAIQASEGHDHQSFIAAILCEAFMYYGSSVIDTKGYTLVAIEASHNLCEDALDDTLYNRIKELAPRFSRIAIYRSIHRLSYLHTYTWVEQEMIIREAIKLRTLAMSPMLYSMYELVLTQAEEVFSLLDGHTDEDDCDTKLVDDYVDIYDVGQYLGSSVVENTNTNVEQTLSSEHLQLDKQKPVQDESIPLTIAEENAERVKSEIFLDVDTRIDERVAARFNVQLGGSIELPKGTIHYSPAWRYFLTQKGEAVNWVTMLDLLNDYRFRALVSSEEVKQKTTDSHVAKTIQDELRQGAVDLHYRVATKLGIENASTVRLPHFGELVYNRVTGFVVPTTGEIAILSSVKWGDYIKE